MIGRLTGVVARKSWPEVLLDVRGVGYRLEVPLGTFEGLPGPGGDAALEVVTVLRAESLQLYGFSTRDEKALFEALLGVSGVGPRLALAVLSGVSASALVAAVRDEDAAVLETVSGIGRKTARRLILELKDRLEALAIDGAAPVAAAGAPASGVPADAVAALENLGYRRNEAERAVAAALASDGADDLPRLIRGSLQRLGAHG